MVNINSSDLIYDSEFLAFLTTEGYGGNNPTSSSISFSEFCEKLEKNEVVEPDNKKSSTDLNKSLAYWKSRFNGGRSLSAWIRRN